MKAIVLSDTSSGFPYMDAAPPPSMALFPLRVLALMTMPGNVSPTGSSARPMATPPPFCVPWLFVIALCAMVMPAWP